MQIDFSLFRIVRGAVLSFKDLSLRVFGEKYKKRIKMSVNKD